MFNSSKEAGRRRERNTGEREIEGAGGGIPKVHTCVIHLRHIAKHEITYSSGETINSSIYAQKQTLPQRMGHKFCV